MGWPEAGSGGLLPTLSSDPESQPRDEGWRAVSTPIQFSVNTLH